MGAYILRRLLLMIPTVFGIMAISFVITQFAPGGPVEQALANMSGQNVSLSERVTGGGGDGVHLIQRHPGIGQRRLGGRTLAGRGGVHAAPHRGSAASASRSLARHRPRVGPMLPTGMPSARAICA